MAGIFLGVGGSSDRGHPGATQVARYSGDTSCVLGQVGRFSTSSAASLVMDEIEVSVDSHPWRSAWWLGPCGCLLFWSKGVLVLRVSWVGMPIGIPYAVLRCRPWWQALDRVEGPWHIPPEGV